MKVASTFAAIAVLSIMVTAGAAAQEAVTLTLEDAIQLALEESFEARTERLTLLQAEQNLIAARGRFRTNMDLVLNSPDFSESVQAIRLPDEVPIYNTVGTLRWQSYLALNQPLPTNGNISLRSVLYQVQESVFGDELDNPEKDKRFYSSFRLQLNQPLFIPNQLKLRLERADLNHEMAQREYTRTQLDIIYRVTEAFYGLYKAERSLEIANQDMEQQQELYDLARKKFDAGLIPEVEALQMEVDLSQKRNNLLLAEGGLARTADRFNMTVGLPLERQIQVRTDLEVKFVAVDETRAVEHGMRHRAEVRQTEIDQRLAAITMEETDARSTVRADISAYYDLSGISDPFLDFDTGTNQLLRSSLDDIKQRPHNRGIQLTVTVPLWDSGVNRAEVNAARAILSRRELSIEESRREVAQQIRSAITRMRESEARLEALKQSEEVAGKGYDISLARFDNGDITSADLALDRDRLTMARQNYLDAYIEYQLALADLKRQTLYDWEHDRSLVQVSTS
jgi:outer membrane protein TolC